VNIFCDTSRTHKNVVEFYITMNEAERVEVTNSLSNVDGHLQPDDQDTTAVNITHRHTSQQNIIVTVMAALWNIILYFCPVVSFFLFFIPRLISVAADWMSTILPHMVWP